MKILIITNKMPYPPKDGGCMATLNLATGLADFENQVSIFSITTPKHSFPVENLPLEITKKINFKTVFVDTRFNLFKAIRNFVFSELPYNAERFISQKVEIVLIEMLSEIDFDIIQIEGLYMMPYLKTIRKHAKALVAYRSHNIETEIWQRLVINEPNYFRVFLLNTLAKRLQKLENSIINQYDLIVPITDRDKSVFKQLGNIKPSFTMPFGLEFENLPEIELPFNNIFFLGSLDWIPNQQGLTWFVNEVFIPLRLEFPFLEFHVAGRNAPKKLEEFFKKTEVSYYGEIDSSRDFFKKRGIMVVPLFSGSGMRVKIIEGMAFGKPVVTTKIGAEGISATNDHDILIRNDASSWKEAIKMLLADPEKSRQIGGNAANCVRKNYDNYELTKNLQNFYQYSLSKSSNSLANSSLTI